MNDLLLHPKTRQQIELLLERSPHGLLISGPKGSGKSTLSLHLSAGVLGKEVGTLENYAYFLKINPAGTSISIDEVRQIQQFLKLKVPTSQTGIQRIILIESGERMGAEAQNALLKTLEEPPLDTLIVITVPHPDLLLPTITSRTTELVALPVSLEQAQDFYKDKGFASKEISAGYAISQGQPGLMTAYLRGESTDLIASITQAKEILRLKPAERLLLTDNLAKDKTAIRQLLDACLRITHAGLLSSAQKNSMHVLSWQKKQECVLEAIRIWPHNPSPKLLLDKLFLDL